MLYIPDATIRLISFQCLACNSNTVTHSDQDSCWLTNKKEDSIITHGILLPHTNLYAHSLYHSATHHTYAINSIPTLETWHHHLGHANYNSIADMAKHGLLKGVPLHVTHIPSKCEFCVLGKWTKTAISELCEGGGGSWAARKLDKVWVDLMGPHAVESCIGNRYIMDIVNDYKSCPWSVPLKTKDEAFSKLVIWKHKRETETNLKVRMYCTDNGELKSDKMANWLASIGFYRY